MATVRAMLRGMGEEVDVESLVKQYLPVPGETLRWRLAPHGHWRPSCRSEWREWGQATCPLARLVPPGACAEAGTVATIGDLCPWPQRRARHPRPRGGPGKVANFSEKLATLSGRGRRTRPARHRAGYALAAPRGSLRRMTTATGESWGQAVLFGVAVDISDQRREVTVAVHQPALERQPGESWQLAASCQLFCCCRGCRCGSSSPRPGEFGRSAVAALRCGRGGVVAWVELPTFRKSWQLYLRAPTRPAP